MQNKYDDLDFCLETLYNYVYEPSKSECYIFKPIARNSIKLADIKKPFDFDSKTILTNCQYIGQYNSKWVFKKSSKSRACMICVSEYNSSNPNYDDLTRREMVNARAHYLLSELFHTDGLRHIVFPILNFDVLADQLESEMQEHIKSSNRLCVNVLEHFFKMSTLKEYLDQQEFTLTHWRVLFFQVFYTLAKIAERFPNFRHNNLNLDSIRVYHKVPNNKTKPYQLGDMTFDVPQLGFEIKITDFDHAEFEHQPNNPYYDMHYFTQSLLYYWDDVPSDLVSFVQQIIPEQFRYPDKSQFIGLDESYFDSTASVIMSPSLVIRKNNFFSEFIRNMDSTTASDSDVDTFDAFDQIDSTDSYDSPTDESSIQPRMLARKTKPKQSRTKELDTESDTDDIFDKAEKEFDSQLSDDDSLFTEEPQFSATSDVTSESTESDPEPDPKLQREILKLKKQLKRQEKEIAKLKKRSTRKSYSDTPPVSDSEVQKLARQYGKFTPFQQQPPPNFMYQALNPNGYPQQQMPMQLPQTPQMSIPQMPPQLPMMNEQQPGGFDQSIPINQFNLSQSQGIMPNSMTGGNRDTKRKYVLKKDPRFAVDSSEMNSSNFFF